MCQSQGESEMTVEVEAAEIGLGQIGDLIAVGIERAGKVPEGDSFAHAGLTGQEPPPGLSSKHWKRSASCARVPSSHNSGVSLPSGEYFRPKCC